MSSDPDIKPLLDIMARLRDPEHGCSWDIAQSFATIAPYTIEEAYEVSDAIDRNDMPGLCDELGDLLLQSVFDARIAEEAGHFAFGDVVRAICDKMIRRHPHVFGDADGADAAGWEAIKAAERDARAPEDRSALAGVALPLPALSRAEKLQKRAARTGFDWPDDEGAYAKIAEEIDEVRAAGTAAEKEEEIGDLLFAVTNLARHLKVDPEQALRGANRKFERRFRMMEEEAGEAFRGLDLEAKERLWQSAKRREKQA